MDHVVKHLRYTPDPRLLVGVETGDDAGVLKLSDDLALVLTVDFITPISDDPYEFGRVAAANSLSDVYAMGGKPLSALNVCAFPEKGLTNEDITAILQGGLDAIVEAGAAMAGGHTVRDKELKYGLSVTGTVHPDRIWRNSGVRPGDVLILTKPIGTGVVLQGYQNRKTSAEEFALCIENMSKLNKVACETGLEFRVHGATDITGFGLAGHALGMAKGAGVEIRLRFDDVPRYESAIRLIEKGVKTGADGPNQENVEAYLHFEGDFSKAERRLCVDPQTSGGLLLSVHPEDAGACLALLHERGIADAAIVGEVRAADAPRVTVAR